MSLHLSDSAARLDYRPDDYAPAPDAPAVHAAAVTPALPPCRDGEVEVARLELATRDRDVVSLRVRRQEGRYEYRMVDTQGARWTVPPRVGHRTLTTAELAGLIDGARIEGMARRVDLTDTMRDCVAGGDGVRELLAAAEFVRVRSPLYPGLADLYDSKASAWLARRLRSAYDGHGTGATVLPFAPRVGVA